MATLKDKLASAKRPASKSDEGDDLSIQVANATRELAEARAKLAAAEKTAAEWQSKAEKVEGSLASERMNRALYSAATSAGAIDPDDVVELVRSKGARLEGDKVVFGQGAEVKDAASFVASYLEGKPHLRKAQVSAGSGSPTTQTAGASVAATNTIPAPDRTNPREVAKYYEAQLAASLAAKKNSKSAQ